MRSLEFAAAVSCLVASVLPAQSTPPDSASRSASTNALDSRLTVGSRIRLRLASMSDSVTGRIAAVEGDTLVVARWPQSVFRVAVSDASELSVYGRGQAGQHMAMAFGTTGLVGGTVFYVLWCKHNRDACQADIAEAERQRRESCDSSVVVPSMLALSSLAGALLGAAVGYALTPEHWESVKRPVRFGILPLRRGVMIVATVTLGRR